MTEYESRPVSKLNLYERARLIGTATTFTLRGDPPIAVATGTVGSIVVYDKDVAVVTFSGGYSLSGEVLLVN